jgi:hypothetical protein
MYFDEFVQFNTQVSSELFLSIFDCLHQCVPCAQNFFILKANYLKVLQRKSLEPDSQVKCIVPKCFELPPPLSDKMLNRVTQFEKEPGPSAAQSPQERFRRSSLQSLQSIKVPKRLTIRHRSIFQAPEDSPTRSVGPAASYFELNLSNQREIKDEDGFTTINRDHHNTPADQSHAHLHANEKKEGSRACGMKHEGQLPRKSSTGPSASLDAV